MTTIEIRPLDKKDFNETLKVIKSGVRSTPTEITPTELANDIASSYTPESLNERLREADYFTARIGNKIVGVIGLKNAEIRTFFVHADFQGQGVGSVLYKTAENRARELKIKTLSVCGSQYATPIYLHFGFTIVGKKHKERLGIPYFDYLMEKPLT